MKNFAGLVAAALAATPASAHYIFQQLAVDDTEFAVWEHSMSIDICLLFPGSKNIKKEAKGRQESREED